MAFLRTLLLLTLPFTASAESIFKITKALYPALSNHGKVCKHFYGDGAEVVDFNDLKAMHSVKLDALMDELEVKETTNREHYFVQNQGKALYSGKHAYFFENHGGPPPSYFSKVDGTEGLNLGVTDKYGHVMCKLPPAP